MVDVVAAARRFRHEARQRGNPARVELARRYAATAAAVQRDVRVMERAAAKARRDGVTLDPTYLRSLSAHQATLTAVRGRLLTAARTTANLTDRETRREIRFALRDARALVGNDVAGTVDETAVLNLLGAGDDRGPLGRLLTQRAGDDADSVMQLLVDGLVRNVPATVTAGKVRALVAGGSYAAALRIVRTETHRARREACRVVYQRTPGVTGWVWVCSLTPTSCGLCWAEHGTVHPLDEPMASHPNCTCECAPFTGQDIDLGTDLFDALTDDEQDEALGAATARAYRDGAVTLNDLVVQGRSALWGPVGHQASLLSVLGARAGDYYRA